MRSLILSSVVVGTLVGCAGKEVYPPALPVAPSWSNREAFLLENPPPEELRYAPPPPLAAPSSVLPMDWDLWRQAPTITCTGKGKRQRCTTAASTTVEQANTGALVRPSARNTNGNQSAIVRYDYKPGRLYEVQTTPTSPTFVQLPPGERLSAPPAVNPNAFSVGIVQQGTGVTRMETVVIRPLEAPHEAMTALLFQSGLSIFLKLVAQDKTGMLSVAWDLPQVAPPAHPEVPIDQRPPTMGERIFAGYTITPGKIVPPWVPVKVFDDGSKSFIQLPGSDLHWTRIPGVFGVTQTGATALVQSRIWVAPDKSGSIMVVSGLHPALELKDSAGLTVKIVRQAPPAGSEVTHAAR